MIDAFVRDCRILAIFSFVGRDEASDKIHCFVMECFVLFGRLATGPYVVEQIFFKYF